MANGGRPSDYTQEIADTICLLIAEGQSLRKICTDESMPDKSTVFRWIARNCTFRDQYAQAKDQGAMVWAEEILDIADDGANDYMELLDESGDVKGYRLNGEHVQRSKLRVDSRKWLLSKLMPKKYGDKVQQELSGPGGGPIKTDSTITFVGVNSKSE